jgi:preprotein translocase subunit Sec63
MWIPGLNIFVGLIAFGWGGALFGLIVTLIAGLGATNEKARNQVQEWWDVLGVSRTATKDEINKAFKRKARQAHPDVGGSDDEMKEINQAREEGLRGKGF